MSREQAPKRRIILIKGTGFKSGKDTAAEIMARLLKDQDKTQKVFKGMFAYTVKQLATRLTGVQMSHVYGINTDKSPFDNLVLDFTQDEKETYHEVWGMTLGRILQVLATEGMRDNFDEKVHVKAEARRLTDLINRSPFQSQDLTIIISDWRFANEAGLDFFMDQDYHWDVHTVEVRREVNREEQVGGRDMKHASETNQLHFQHVIDNNGTLQDLKNNVAKFLESIHEQD